MRPDRLTLRVISTPDQLYPRSLMPADEQSYLAVEALKRDEEVQVCIVRERSNPQLRLFWAVLDHVAKSTAWQDPERLLVAVKLKLGRYDLMQLPNGKAVPVPRSIAFDKMSQEDFQVFMDRAIQVICEHVLGGNMDSEELINEVQGFRSAPNVPAGQAKA